MAAATLPLSRSMRMPLTTRQDTNDSFRSIDEWGPSSVPPTSQSNVPWDDQVVPALRKKLEAESRDLTKRISRIQESDNGWSRSRESLVAREPRNLAHARDYQDLRISREVVHKHHRESSIDQFHNRFASVRAPSRQTSQDLAASSFPFDLAESHDSSASRSSVVFNEATARAREKARQIAAQRKSQQLDASKDSVASSNDTNGYASRTGVESSIDTIPEGHTATAQSLPSFHMKRLRSQSNPSRPSLDVINPNNDSGPRRTQNASPSEPMPTFDPTANPVNQKANGHQRSSSLSRRKAAKAVAHDPALLDEFGPLGATPSPTAKLLQAHKQADPASPSANASPSTRNRNIQPDAFRSLSRPDQPRGIRESSAPPSFGGDTTVSEFGGSPGSKSLNNWEDQIIPTVARKLQQEQFLKAGKEGRLSRYEGLIDTWDKNGLPLSRSDVMAMQKAKKLQEEEEMKQQQQQLDEEVEEQHLTPGLAPAWQPGSSTLSPTTDTAFGERTRSRASSRHSQRSARSYQQQQLPQQEVVPMQTFQPAPEQDPAAHVSTSSTQPQAGGARQHDNDKVDKSGCCCIVM